RPAGPQWSIFWAGLAAAVAGVLVYFLIAYHGVGKGLKRANSIADERSRQSPAKPEPN
ncbi:MAG: hypothetical protein HYY23_19550, partial [Verrucomicrobia bacterium]|nr:hypothetical protein [Verrucomicrobiota bacterium]